MKHSLYSAYIRERSDKHILEDESGFAVYSYLEDYVYIEDIFVVKEAREGGIASRYADAVAREAKGKGYSKMLGSVSTLAKNSTDSVKVLLAYGFKLLESNGEMIYFYKEI